MTLDQLNAATRLSAKISVYTELQSDIVYAKVYKGEDDGYLKRVACDELEERLTAYCRELVVSITKELEEEFAAL